MWGIFSDGLYYLSETVRFEIIVSNCIYIGLYNKLLLLVCVKGCYGMCVLVKKLFYKEGSCNCPDRIIFLV